MTNQRHLLYAALRNDFPSYVQKCFEEINPGQTLQMTWYVRALCYYLLACALGGIPRLAICLPPRHLKTICATQALPTYLLGLDPSRRIICISYSNELTRAQARDRRRIMNSDWYRAIFPGTRIASGGGSDTAVELRTTENGGWYATSVNGTITGRGGDLIIIDDPIKPNDIMSKAERDSVNAWYGSTVSTRLDDPTKGRIIIVMQRVHGDDLVGHVMGLHGDLWTLLRIPAIAKEGEVYQLSDTEGDVYVRQPGELIDPDRMDEDALERQRGEMGSYNFHAQYLQNPQPEAGNLVRREWFGTYSLDDRQTHPDAVIMSWDTAFGEGRNSDYSVCITWEVRGGRYMVTDVFRQRLEYPDLKTMAIEKANARRADYVLIERAASGLGLGPDIRPHVAARVISRPPRGDKIMRLQMASSLIEGGHVLLSEDKPHWHAGYMEELIGFPNGRYDDQVDATSLFLNWVRGMAFRSRVDGQRARRARPNRQRPRGRRRLRAA